MTINRRDFGKWLVVNALGVTTLGALVAGCGPSRRPKSPGVAIPIPEPSKPVEFIVNLDQTIGTVHEFYHDQNIT